MFKFYKIPNLETAEKIIGNNPSIKFSSAFDLNDPFELKFNLKIDPYSVEQKKEFFINNPDKKLEDFKKWQSKITYQFIWFKEQELRNGLSQILTLTCFTESNQNNLMWSHYANNHRGICVEYSVELFDYFKSLDNYLTNGKVEYSDKPPTIDYLESKDSKAKKMLFNKQSEWKYEKEHRVILQSRNDADYIPIDSKFIKAVFLGSKCETALSNIIIEICKLNGIKLYHGISLGESYKIQFKEHIEGTLYMKSFWK